MSANSVGVVDPATGAIDDEVTDVPTPTRVAASEDAIWVTSTDGNSVTHIDADSHDSETSSPSATGLRVSPTAPATSG